MFKNRIENPFLRGLIEWVLAIGLAFLLFFVMRSYIFRIAHVTGDSMGPTLNHGDMVVLNRFVYLFSPPRAGDIVAFPYQENPSEFYIKRVIGVPGDIIDLQNGEFLINGQLLDDPFSGDFVLVSGDVNFPVEVEDGRFFVLGDNRNGSKDSRFVAVGTVPGRDMVGRVAVRIWPFGALGQVE